MKDSAKPSKLKSLEESVMKFSDIMIASTSSNHDEICFWEPKTLAPYEPVIEKKFIAAPNTLQVSSSNYITACHNQKTTMNVWRWDKKEPLLRFPLKEQLTATKISHNNSTMYVGGSKSGRLCVWQMQTGQILGEIESAHYMEINDLDISSSNDLIITGGKDCKVKIWIMAELFTNMREQNEKQCLVEFGEHTAEITQVQFSQNNCQRAFSASIDKLFKVYDIVAKCTIKNIQAQSPILKMLVDQIEAQVYFACENQNVYGYSLELSASDQKSKHKRTLQHKKKITAMCLTFDGQYLVSGDSQGLIYIWNISTDYNQSSSTLTSPRGGVILATAVADRNQKASASLEQQHTLLTTFELHKDKGAITNLICMYRPLSLYGLTANMKAYEPTEVKLFQKVFNHELENENIMVQLKLGNYINQKQDSLWDKIAEQEEFDYLIRSSQRVLKPEGAIKGQSKQVEASADDDFIGISKKQDEKMEMSEVEKLKEENKRLKRTLLERYDSTFN